MIFYELFRVSKISTGSLVKMHPVRGKGDTSRLPHSRVLDKHCCCFSPRGPSPPLCGWGRSDFSDLNTRLLRVTGRAKLSQHCALDPSRLRPLFSRFLEGSLCRKGSFLSCPVALLLQIMCPLEGSCPGNIQDQPPGGGRPGRHLMAPSAGRLTPAHHPAQPPRLAHRLSSAAYKGLDL